MGKQYIVYNPHAGNGTCKQNAEVLETCLYKNAEYVDITQIREYASFFNGLEKDDIVVLCGGDGTLNRFINDIQGVTIRNEIWYYSCGSGNDFARDICGGTTEKPFLLNEYIKDLPVVRVNGEERRFLNGIGYGIDGYCCEEGDRQRERSRKHIDYTSIAIKGLLFHYKPTNATIVVDGKTYRYEKVWLAPTMYGRFYGGGMTPAPAQDRKAKDKKLSIMLFYGSGKIKTLCIFPSIFTGKHVEKKKNVCVLTGKEITVCFDEPRALQIDGETIKNVSEYTASI